MPQIYIDFGGWENDTCTRELLLNLTDASKNNKWYMKQNLLICWVQINLKLRIKAMNRSELKFFIDYFLLGNPVGFKKYSIQGVSKKMYPILKYNFD